MSNKPSWDDAPEWANYLAMDENGDWYWYENEPEKRSDCWFSNGGRYRAVEFNWETSLEKRP